MALALPTSLSPSRLSSFTSCGLQFRFSAIDRLPEPPTVAATRGTLVHAALEHLFTLPAPERVPAAADGCLDAAVERLRTDPDWTGLALDEAGEARMRDEAAGLVARYFRLEDPTTVHPVGLELKLEVEVGGVRLRGIIDRLDLVGGELVVTDYKTGRAPGDAYARQRMTGVHLYSLMCERWFGRRPVRVQLLHLAEPVAGQALRSRRPRLGGQLERLLRQAGRGRPGELHGDGRPVLRHAGDQPGRHGPDASRAGPARRGRQSFPPARSARAETAPIAGSAQRSSSDCARAA